MGPPWFGLCGCDWGIGARFATWACCKCWIDCWCCRAGGRLTNCCWGAGPRFTIGGLVKSINLLGLIEYVPMFRYCMLYRGAWYCWGASGLLWIVGLCWWFGCWCTCWIICGCCDCCDLNEWNTFLLWVDNSRWNEPLTPYKESFAVLLAKQTVVAEFDQSKYRL